MCVIVCAASRSKCTAVSILQVGCTWRWIVGSPIKQCARGQAHSPLWTPVVIAPGILLPLETWSLAYSSLIKLSIHHTRKHAHIYMQTRRHMQTQWQACSQIVYTSGFSCSLCWRRVYSATRVIHKDGYENRCTCSPMNTHTHTFTDAHLQKQSGIMPAMNSKRWLFKYIPPSPSSESETLY